MNEIQIFKNEVFGSVRTLYINSEPWFVGKDVADILGYGNNRKALLDHVDEEDRNTVTIRDGNKGNPNQVIINESGLYSLILSSKLPKAKEFKRWVTHDVLPSIRRHGIYMADEVLDQVIRDPEKLIEYSEKLKEEKRAAEIAASCLLGTQLRKIASSVKCKHDVFFNELIDKGYIKRDSENCDYLACPETTDDGVFEIHNFCGEDSAIKVERYIVSEKGITFFRNLALNLKQNM